MAKEYRRFIKIYGELIASPRFPTKEEADEWYRGKKSEIEKVKKGWKVRNAPTFLEFTASWMKLLIANYEKPTWAGYEANLRIHLLPYLKDYRIDQISRAKCREVLLNVTRNGFSENHRKHVQATLSKIFTDAMNTEPPVREDNPCYRLKLDGKREKTKFQPSTIEHPDELLDFLKAAKEISDLHFVFACLGLMSALRKGELIALRWRNIRWRTQEIRVNARYRQAMNMVDAGTKGGPERIVPVPAELIEVLKAYRERALYRADDDFILTKPDGTHWRSRAFHDLFVAIRNKANRPDLTIHSMRHTYGRMFAMKGGNMRALQAILGHSSNYMTAIYSELNAKQVKPFANQMGIKISDTIDTDDTKNDTKNSDK